MARRFFVGFLLCGASAALVAACDGGRWGYDYVYPYGPGRAYVCSQFTSCGSCTPIEGCGWCAFDGGGACVADPDFCGVNQFSFTWNREGCASLGGTSTDGGPAPPDAASTPPPADAASTPPATSEAGRPPASTDAGADR